MIPFDGVDFMRFDSLLTAGELALRARARSFVEAKVLPIIGDCVERAEFPLDIVPALADEGFLGAGLEGYGCRGIEEVAYGLLMQELERGDSAIRTFCSVQSALVMYPIHAFGSAEQKEAWLPRLRTGEAVGCFGLTEPAHGSNPAGMETRVSREGDACVLNGVKRWIGNATIADVAVIWARNDEGAVEGFLVEKGTAGFNTSLIERKFSLRAATTGQIELRDCRIPSANRLPHARGLRAAFQCLDKARYGIAWGAIGAAMACYQEALAYSKKRMQFGKPIASFQLVQAKLVEMITEITKMQFMTLQVGRLLERSQADRGHISMIKRNNVSHALDIARAARDILAAAGITMDYASGRHLCNLESVKTYEGTHDIHTLILGESITGFRAFG